MKLKSLALAASAAFVRATGRAQTEIQWWHSMTAVNNEWVNDLAKQFNESQKEFKVIPTYKGSYTDSFTAAIAAYRAGQAPHILQVFEVGTATMMASKGATCCGKIMTPATFDPGLLPRRGWLHRAQRLSFLPNSSTTVFYMTRSKAAGIDTTKMPPRGPTSPLPPPS
jgi:sn-glycerol 3-phosphate transport system substrate-binding protein